MTVRLLFVGLDERDVPVVPEDLDIYYEVKGWHTLPTLHDFDVIIADLHDLNDYLQVREALNARWKFQKQVQTGGLLIIFFAPHQAYAPLVGKPGDSAIGRYGWIPNRDSFEVNEEKGDSVVILKSDFESFFEKVGIENISWELYFSKKAQSIVELTALITNRAGYPISLKIPEGRGNVILLPLFSDRKEAMRRMLETALPNLYPNLRRTVAKPANGITRPGWTEEYAFDKKKDLMRKVESYDKDIQKYTEFEKLIYSRDIELVQSVALALKELGFEVLVTAKEGTTHDLEMKFNEKYSAVAEVKGLLSPLKTEHLRQLLHYFIDKRDVEGVKSIKAVFFVNHQLNKKPENRDIVPCTSTALEAAQKHGIAIVSTYDLFEALRKVVHEKSTKEEVRSKIISGIGHVNVGIS